MIVVYWAACACIIIAYYSGKKASKDDNTTWAVVSVVLIIVLIIVFYNADKINGQEVLVGKVININEQSVVIETDDGKVKKIDIAGQDPAGFSDKKVIATFVVMPSGVENDGYRLFLYDEIIENSD